MEKTEKSNIFSGGGYYYKHPSTIWEQIREEIVAQIICGELKQGDKAPSLTEVTVKFNCGRTTAQKALESLCESKILYTEPGRGFFVSKTAKAIESLEAEYKASMENALHKYVVMSKNLKISDEEIFQEVRKYLQNNS